MRCNAYNSNLRNLYDLNYVEKLESKLDIETISGGVGLTSLTSTHPHYCHINEYFRALLSVLAEESWNKQANIRFRQTSMVIMCIIFLHFSILGIYVGDMLKKMYFNLIFLICYSYRKANIYIFTQSLHPQCNALFS